jgi:hypothetical protein
MQANFEGDLSERQRWRAADIASDADLRTCAPPGILACAWLQDHSLAVSQDWRLPRPGTCRRAQSDNLRESNVSLFETERGVPRRCQTIW